MKSFITDENPDLLETKLVDILKDFKINDSKTLRIEEEQADDSLILVKTKNQEAVKEDATNLPNWTVSPYDLGGHSPYFSSQKIFSSSSSFYFLTFSR